MNAHISWATPTKGPRVDPLAQWIHPQMPPESDGASDGRPRASATPGLVSGIDQRVQSLMEPQGEKLNYARGVAEVTETLLVKEPAAPPNTQRCWVLFTSNR